MPALSTPSLVRGSSTAPSEVREAFAELRRQLSTSRATPATPESTRALADAIVEAHEAVTSLPARLLSRELAAEGLALAREIAATRLQTLLAPLLSERVELHADRTTPALIGRMLISEGWRSSETPLLSGVPDAMWGDYARWLFLPPSDFLAPEEAQAFAAHVARHLAELNRWIKRNPGSAAVRAAADAYLSVSEGVSFAGGGSRAREAAMQRGEFLARYGAPAQCEPWDGMLMPRLGRRLRVGVVNPSFGPDADLRLLRPAYAQLDARGFETTLISLSEADAEYAASTRGSARECIVLPAEVTEQVTKLRAMELDVILFGGDVGSRLDDVTRLALHRVAPLQVAITRGNATTGLPEVDVIVASDRSSGAASSDAFVERLGLLRGPACFFAVPTTALDPDGEDPRQALGLPASATLFVSVATAAGVSAETHSRWAKVLAETPDSRLLIARVADEREAESAAGVNAFCARLGEALDACDVPSERVSVFPVASEALNNVRTLLRVADVYLDALAGADPIWAAEALSLGRPVIAASDGSGAHVVRSLDMGDLVTPDETSYLQLAGKLAADSAARAAITARIEAAVATGKGFCDLLAAGDAFGALLETAFDELTALGREDFRAQREPVRCFAPDDIAETIAAGEAALASGDQAMAASQAELAIRADPANVAAKVLRGRVLLAEGATARSVAYLLAAAEARGDDAELWFVVAEALRQNQQSGEAVQALEISLRLDRSRVEGWLMLVEIADQAGAVEIAGEARAVLREIAPNDPRVMAMV